MRDVAEWVGYYIQKAIRKSLKGLIEESNHSVYALKDVKVICGMHRRRR